MGTEFGTPLVPVALDVPPSTEVCGLKLMACKARALINGDWERLVVKINNGKGNDCEMHHIVKKKRKKGT